jgi:hypothetical protein
MAKMTQERKVRQTHFLRLFQDVTSELVEGNDEKFKVLREGDEEALGALAAEYELAQDELVFACDALLALRMAAERLTSTMGGPY